jgi:hypothetical protein
MKKTWKRSLALLLGILLALAVPAPAASAADEGTVGFAIHLVS